MATIQIVEVNESTVKINTEAVNQILEKVADLPVVILSVNGSSREGKSYLLNFFVRYFKSHGPGSTHSEEWFNLDLPPEEMFPFKSGRERETIGLNLYSQPFIISTKYESKLAVLLLDSQGLFDDKTTFKQNAVIFALSNLFSSVLIYNVKSKMEEDLLQNIQFFSTYAQAITTQAEAEDQLPSLMFLIRDFSFEQEFPLGYHPRLANAEAKGNYFHSCFSISESMPQENRIVRKEVLKKFPQIGMFALPFPGKEFLKDSTHNFPDKDFQYFLHQFVTMMTQEAFLVPKQINGKELTGRELQGKVRQWALLCEESASKFPAAQNLSESQNIMRNEMAVFTSFDIFRERFEEFFRTSSSGAEERELKSKYNQFFAEASQAYRNLRRNESEATIDRYLRKLAESCGDIYENYYSKLNDSYLSKTEVDAGHLALERSNTQVLRTLRKQIENLKETCPSLSNIDPKKPPVKPRRTFTAKISDTGSLIRGQDPPSEQDVLILTNEEQNVQSRTAVAILADRKPSIPEKPERLKALMSNSIRREPVAVSHSPNSSRQRPLRYKIKNFFTLLFVEPARELKSKVRTLLDDTRKQIGRPGSSRYSSFKN